MVINNRVSLSFVQLPDDGLGDFATGVITGMSTGGSFPTPPVTTTILEEQRDTFLEKLQATINGGKQATAEKNAARAILIGSLRRNAAYVQALAGTDLALLLSSGYLATSTNRERAVLPKPVVDTLDNLQSTKLMLRLKPDRNARSYEVRIKNGTGNWSQAGIYTQSRRIVLEDLTPGATYEVQARGVGGSTGYSDWSDPASRIVT